MVAPANKASSSSLISSRQNPRSRNSESGDPMRRSFGGNPFAKPTVIANPRGFNNSNPTPANSPSDFLRRNSIGRENNLVRCVSEDKENEKDQIPTNPLRAPPTPKGAKNFMSPTISAASKMNASPRKKILTEKNEGDISSVSFSDVRSLIMEDTGNQPARSSVSFSDVVTIIGEDNEPISSSKMGLNQRKQLEPSYDITITDLDHKEALESNEASEPNEAVVIEEKGSVNLDPSFKISPRPLDARGCSLGAPLDANPLILPYDPKTNYLSPRPQFLHYKPNPRIEHYLSDGKQLEEIFASESSSDSEVSEQETQSENSEKKLEDNSQEDESAKEEENEEEEEEEEEEEMDEQSPEQSPKQTVKENAETVNGASEAHRFRRFKFLGWVFVLTMACLALSATFSQSTELSMLKDSSFYDFYVPPEIIEFAKANFEQMGVNFKTWSESSLSFIWNLVPNIGEGKELSPLHFHNLTDLLDRGSFDGMFQLTRGEDTIAEQNHQEMTVGESLEKTIKEENFEMGYEDPVQQEIDGENYFEEISEEDGNLETHELQQGIEAEVIEHDNLNEQKLENCDSAALDIDPRLQNYFESVSEDVNGQQEIEAEVESAVSSEIVPESDDIIVKGEISPESQAAIVMKVSEARQELGKNDFSIISSKEEILTEVSEASEAENDIRPEIESAVSSEIVPESDHTNVKGELSLESLLSDIAIKVSKAQEEIGKSECCIISPNDEIPTEVSEASEAENDIRTEKESSKEENEFLEETGGKISAKESQRSVQKLLTTQNGLGFSLTVLLAATAFFFIKKAKLITPNSAASSFEQPPVSKELDYSPVSVETLIKEKLSSLNFQTEVDDTTEESCPSEMSSSFQKSSSFYSEKGFKDSNEAQSRERKNARRNNNSFRRESLASSASEYSTDSPSYGSFTTYEKIASRSGYVVEEAITPVRRSSRLRNQVSGQ